MNLVNLVNLIHVLLMYQHNYTYSHVCAVYALISKFTKFTNFIGGCHPTQTRAGWLQGVNGSR